MLIIEFVHHYCSSTTHTVEYRAVEKCSKISECRTCKCEIKTQRNSSVWQSVDCCV